MSKTIKDLTVVELKAELYDLLVRSQQNKAMVDAINKELSERAKVGAVTVTDKTLKTDEETTA